MSEHAKGSDQVGAGEPTVIDQTLTALATFGEQVALTLDQPGGLVHWTHRDLLDRTRREAHRLEALGVGRGSVVSVLTGDRPLTFVLRWAINALGGAVNVIPDGYAATALRELLIAAAPNVLLTDSTRRDLAAEAAATAGPLRVVDVEATDPPDDTSALTVAAEPGDLAAVQLTSGSTGSPKAVPRRMAPPTPSSVLADWRDTVQLLCTPVAHVGGAVAMLALRAGGRVVIQPGFDPQRALAAIARERVTTIMPLFPRHLVQLLDHPDLATTDTSSLQSLRLGGSPASPVRIGEAIARFGPIVSQVYGTIEATNITSITAGELAEHPELRSTVGRPEPGVELSLRDTSGTEVEQGSIGEVWVKSPAIMPGYINAPQDTAAVLQDGWLRTGDLGRLDRAGYLTLMGRSKDLIYAERARIYPPDLEEVLTEHVDVAAAAVFGISNSDGVESAAAAVVPRPGRVPRHEDLITWVAERRGARLTPAVIHVVDDLPTLASGKVDRHALRERYTASAPAS